MQGQPEYSGGCQCGAIRFQVRGELTDSSICHCRMCQKAFGAYYAPLVSVRGVQFSWTRGQPRYFQSSNVVRRGFCADCGTPLTYEAPDGVAVAAGAFDQPERLPPTIQYGVERKLPFVDGLGRLPARRTEEDVAALEFLATIVSHQHPDHDTPHWPPRSRPAEG
ncbi:MULTISPECIES: GFA family protein [Stenotrophomonas]|uniref:GFA family protein n=1 Tax=Stenotrophomonas lactitubi TaxID=2045214 RepID=A0AAW4GHB5_9GAMM|nr:MULTISPECIES: GFA family protein [Stenotrophomonas]MBM9914112.1 GFA family protein [Stenotrophomonas lactitubi]MBM9920544.1 GFA family protein [Stenotrophomonas lactitubi]MBM9939663.1 GFA family protein [Stenotrophomonas lactitubi]